MTKTKLVRKLPGRADEKLWVDDGSLAKRSGYSAAAIRPIKVRFLGAATSDGWMSIFVGNKILFVR